MHLGRFHATIYDLTQHFKAIDLPGKLELCASALDQYASSQAQQQLDVFRASFGKLLTASEITDPDLLQPFAQQLISQLEIRDILNPDLTATLNNIIQERAFDHAGIATDFRSLAAKITKKTNSIAIIDKSFTDLKIEFERVSDSEAEIGIMLPREVVGESLIDLNTEFSKLSQLFRAINELTGADEYDPKVRTISSSSWQIFMDLNPTQILVWVVAIERIISLYKSNLEIKRLQQQLLNNEIPKEITDLIEKEIERRVSSSMETLAAELRKEHSKMEDQGRLNEIEIQLNQGLAYLAMRINQGTEIEINVGVPEEPTKQQADIQEDSQNHSNIEELESKIELISKLRELKKRGQIVSTETRNIDNKSHAFLNYFNSVKDKPDSSRTST